MSYPLISEYVEAIRFAEDNFSTLTNLRSVMENGRPFMSSGNFAVVFKMKDVTTGKLYAVKCFTRDEEQRERSYRLISDELNGVNSLYLTSIKYLEKELFVDVSGSSENEFPVLLMDWVEGQTMDAYIRENINDKWELERLCRNFCRMGAWLLEQPFAHGDLKPDNIMISADAMPLLVDYDGMYVPAMKGETARELGSPDYRHPLRTEKDFDEHIDDFPLASIALSLKAISLDPSLLERYGAADRLLFSATDYADLSKCAVLKEVTSLYSDSELQKLNSIFLLASSQKSLPTSMSQMFIPTGQWDNEEALSTKVTDEDLAEAWKDEYGVLYSKDRKRLLKCENWHLTEYVVKDGTRVICDYAFRWDDNLVSITLPISLSSIGYDTFAGCNNLVSITLPKGLREIKGNPFIHCNVQISSKSPQFKIENALLIQGESIICVIGSPETVTIPNYITHIGDCAFLECENLSSVKFPKNLNKIGAFAFAECDNLGSIEFPDGLISIGNSAFSYCKNLKSISLPNCLTSIGNNVFSGCYNLVSIKFPDSLTSIEDSLFSSCKNLVEIEFPHYLTSIGNGVFSDCDNLVSIKLPDSLTSIGDLVFSNCKKLSEIEFPHDLTSIGYGAFLGCDNLVSIKLPDSLASIGDSAFSHCKKLAKIEFPCCLTSIGDRVFWGCKNLTYIKLPDKLTSIGDETFSYCKNLTSIELPDGLTCIGDRAFHNCDNLTFIKLPNKLSSIGDFAFIGCKNLASFVPPDSLISIGNGAFYGCKNLTEIGLPKKLQKIEGQPFDNIIQISNSSPFFKVENDLLIQDNKIIRVNGNPKSITIPNYVTNIGERAFYGCKELSSISLPRGLTSIENKAFEHCERLTSITMSETVDTIWNSVLWDCYSLQEICIKCEPDSDLSSVKEKFKKLIPTHHHDKIITVYRTNVTDEDLAEAWRDEYGVLYSKDRKRLLKCENSNLTDYNVMDGTIVICDMAFGMGLHLLSIHLPNSLRSVGDSAFRHCEWLASINLPNNLTSIGTDSFCYCWDLTSINLPNSLMTIEKGAFSNCTKLASINLPEGLTSIRDGAFAGCDALVSIILPNSITSIGEGAFSGCKELSYVNLPNNLNSIGDRAFWLCRNLTTVNIPGTLTSIGDWVFEGCNKLSITLRENLREINGNIFAGCNEIQILNKSPYFKIENDLLIQDQSVICAIGNPQTIIVPPYITHIGEKAFYKCTNLKSINLSENLLSIGEWAFDGCTNLSTISLPKSLQQISGNPFMDCNIQISSKSPYFRIENDLLIHDKTVICVIGNPKIVIMPNYITNIGEDAFDGCTNLTDIKLSENLKTIGDMAFWDCENLISINLPDSLSTIGNNVFDMCSKLSSIIFPENTVFSGDDTQFYDCDELEEIQIRCNPNSDFSSVKEKFQKILPPELWNKIEIIEKNS